MEKEKMDAESATNRAQVGSHRLFVLGNLLGSLLSPLNLIMLQQSRTPYCLPLPVLAASQTTSHGSFLGSHTLQVNAKVSELQAEKEELMRRLGIKR